MMVLNFTLDDIPTADPFDARVEYFQLTLSSDKEPTILTRNLFVGTYKTALLTSAASFKNSTSGSVTGLTQMNLVIALMDQTMT
jgi:hypothetical protein